ncbi:hypothetical protein K491DRAFT_587083 [Lophiostoma macrostomum CBS 122681]|uniref:Programmed cell death protein 2 C-terminal domain-containing protein n=1 Tax=Lophiostoma macrostomum CBS 122681 TaxID=1314788 RepID=A0A6A6TNY5_9PLEO|nr:hypothetical protein K491DRAFT_587083 [Lophiostoma macrostomum CBS 122681]
MPPYDSDSSDEGEDYTETNVLLGYASKESTGDSISHLGGEPTWLDEKTSPSGELAKCKVCNNLLTLLLELNGDLPDHFPGHERRLYIWSCRRKTCRRKEGSIRGVRGVRIAKGFSTKSAAKKAEKQELQKQKETQPNLGGSLFGVKTDSSSGPANPFSNPFASTTNEKAPANPFASSTSSAPPISSPPSVQISSPEPSSTTALPETFASKLRISTPPPNQIPQFHSPWPSSSSFPPAYPHYHLDAEYETLDPSTPEIPSNARMDLDAPSSSGGGGGKEDREVFESTLDKTFQKFADRVGQNPEQVLRYEFRGEPLLYSDVDAVGKGLAPHVEHGASNVKVTTATSSRGSSGIPRCQTCGADRVFEVQLTPHAITELEVDEMGLEGMEWGSVILGVCERDCQPSEVREGEVGYLEEWIGVQWEEIASKR